MRILTVKIPQFIIESIYSSIKKRSYKMADSAIKLNKKDAIQAQKGFDALPVFVQFIIGVLALLAIVAVGFAVFYVLDILLLDFDPIGKLAGIISGAAK